MSCEVVTITIRPIPSISTSSLHSPITFVPKQPNVPDYTHSVYASNWVSLIHTIQSSDSPWSTKNVGWLTFYALPTGFRNSIQIQHLPLLHFGLDPSIALITRPYCNKYAPLGNSTRNSQSTFWEHWRFSASTSSPRPDQAKRSTAGHHEYSVLRGGTTCLDEVDTQSNSRKAPVSKPDAATISRQIHYRKTFRTKHQSEDKPQDSANQWNHIPLFNQASNCGCPWITTWRSFLLASVLLFDDHIGTIEL